MMRITGEAKRMFIQFAEHGGTVLGLHTNGRVEKSRELTEAEKAMLFDKLVEGWPTLSAWLKDEPVK